MNRYVFLVIACSSSLLFAATDVPPRVRDGVLDLSRRSLTELPDFTPFAAQAAEVTVVDCSYNNLTAIPDGAFSVFPNLEELRCHHNASLARVAPAAFADNRQLRVLDLRFGACEALPPDLLQDNVLLEDLLLGNNRLAALPTLSECRQLQVLEAAHNRLAELPDCHELKALEVLVLDHNQLAALSVDRLPLGVENSLRYLLCTHNQIAALEPAFIAALPGQGIIDVRENPCSYVAATKEALAAAGYAEVAGNSCAGDATKAERVSGLLHDDMSEKFLSYLARTGQLPHEYPLRRLLGRRTSLASLRTGWCDTFNTIYRYQYWIGIGVGLLGGGIIGFMCKKAVGDKIEEKVKEKTKEIVKRVLIGAAIGGVVGAGAVALNAKYGFYAEGETVYLDRGTGTVDVTGDLKSSYTGMARLLALVATLKQYLVAWLTYVRYIREYDSYTYGEKRLRTLLAQFEETLHVKVRAALHVESEPVFIEMVTTLLADDAYGEVRRHTAADMWRKAELAEEAFDVPAEAVSFFSADKQVLLRNTLVSFAESARMLRTALYNRYLGSHDAVPLIRLRAQSDPLLATLRDVRIHILDPLLRKLGAEGHRLAVGGSEEEGVLDEWYVELAHLATIGRDVERVIGELAA